MLSPFEWWCRNFILPDICKPCLFVFLRNLFYLTAVALGHSTQTCKRAFLELEDDGLILRVRWEIGAPNRIYVLVPKKRD